MHSIEMGESIEAVRGCTLRVVAEPLPDQGPYMRLGSYMVQTTDRWQPLVVSVKVPLLLPA